MNQLIGSFPTIERENLRARLGLRIAAALSENAERAPHDISERLRVARHTALRRAAEVGRPAIAASPASTRIVGTTGRGAAMLGGGPARWWFRFASVAPLAVLAFGLMAIDRLHDEEQTAAAAEVDSALLADDLPPDAYSDPGFVRYLKSDETP